MPERFRQMTPRAAFASDAIHACRRAALAESG
jgi:hypothetical protein